MERRPRRIEHIEARFKDRGDVIKREDRMKRKFVDGQIDGKCRLDRGDSPEKIKKTDKFEKRCEDAKNTDRANIDRGEKGKNRLPNSNLPEKTVKRIYEKMRAEVKPLNIEKRRKLAEKYTFRKAINDNCSVQSSTKRDTDIDEPDSLVIKIDRIFKNHQTNDGKRGRQASPSIASYNGDKDNNADKIDRKPIVKTVTNKETAKVYKAVTFEENRKVTPLKIRIPNKMTSSKKSDSPSTSLSSVKEKPQVKKMTKKKRVFSPELARPKSVVTEVAKWAPMSVTKHTRPYYEAWVDTTLTAVSRHADKALEERTLIESVKKAMETPTLPAFTIEDLTSEKFTGMIRVNHRR